jgi:uncharacterized membrane protein
MGGVALVFVIRVFAALGFIILWQAGAANVKFLSYRRKVVWELQIQRHRTMTQALLPLLLAAHLLAAVFWVGGMAFAYMVLRPSAGALEPAARLTLWRHVFARFLPNVAIAIVVLLVSGYGMQFIHYGGFRGVAQYVHLMQAIGIVMMLLYLHLVFAPWRRFRTAVDQGAWPDAAKHLNSIRQIVAINLTLGVITILVGATGRYW